jgi:hypothetical protein
MVKDSEILDQAERLRMEKTKSRSNFSDHGLKMPALSPSLFQFIGEDMAHILLHSICFYLQIWKTGQAVYGPLQNELGADAPSAEEDHCIYSR